MKGNGYGKAFLLFLAILVGCSLASSLSYTGIAYATQTSPSQTIMERIDTAGMLGYGAGAIVFGAMILFIAMVVITIGTKPFK
jgi:hypothetical protein